MKKLLLIVVLTAFITACSYRLSFNDQVEALESAGWEIDVVPVGSGGAFDLVDEFDGVENIAVGGKGDLSAGDYSFVYVIEFSSRKDASNAYDALFEDLDESEGIYFQLYLTRAFVQFILSTNPNGVDDFEETLSLN